MNRIIIATIVGILFSNIAISQAQQFSVEGLKAICHKARFTVRVVDEASHPLHNVTVAQGFTSFSNGIPEDVCKGLTDVSGLFTCEGFLWHKSDLGGKIESPDYYRGYCPVKFTGETNTPSNRWLPWDATFTTILRPKVKPISMYARRVESAVPAVDQPCGFDLEIGDWVMPHGKGIKKDLIFTLHQDYRSMQDFDIRGELAFAGSLDGVQETFIPEIGKNSDFRWERQAPENGYQAKFTLQNTWAPGEREGNIITHSFKKETEWQGYFFRVRSVEQDGKIVSAHYGKLRGGIAIWPDEKSGKPLLVFTYYLNPTSLDRNMEFDPEKNLFRDLKWDERRRDP